MHTHSRHRRGFTLLEVMTTVVILIILSALAGTYMIYGMGKARMNNAVFDATALINGAQMRAISRGSPHYVIIDQTPDSRVRIHVVERSEDLPTLNWGALDWTKELTVALAFTRTQPDGTVMLVNAPVRDELVLGDGAGVSGNGLAFLDLDSSLIRRPLPAPFNTLAIATPLITPSEEDKPTGDLMAGCNFCVNPSGHPYGVLRFNADGTVQVMTGNAPSGAVIAFASNVPSEQGVAPKLLTVSAPAGATTVF